MHATSLWARRLVRGLSAALGAAALLCSTPALAGKVYLMGGGYADKNTDLFVQGLRKATGKDMGFTPNVNSTSNCSTDWATTPCPRIAVVTSAKDNFAVGQDAYLNDLLGKRGFYNLFQTHGFAPRFITVHVDNYNRHAYSGNPDGDANIQTINQADVVWFAGGDQAKIARSWLRNDGSDTPLAAALRAAWNNGNGAVVMAGDSAGNHIMNGTMHGAGISYGYLYFNANLQAKAITDFAQFGDTRDGLNTLRYLENGATMRGFGFMPSNLLSDTHFDARSSRLGRLAAALRSLSVAQGLGVDEDTGALVDTGTSTVKVYGSGTLIVVDASQASQGNGSYYKVSNLRVSLLTSGDSYQYGARTVTSSKPAITTRYYRGHYDSADIFAAYEVSKSLTRVVDQADSYNLGRAPRPVYDSGPQYPGNAPTITVRFTRDGTTRGYYGNGRYTAAKVLVDIY